MLLAMANPQDSISPKQIIEFNDQGYLVLKKLINPDLISVFENYALMQRFNNYYLSHEETNSMWRYSDVFGESLLLYLQPLMEKLAARKLFPTNSVLRIYQKGGKLKRHLDRSTCEFSITLTIGYESRDIYPIWLESDNKSIAVNLERGDMMIYKGCDIPHWREEFEGRHWIQLFLHYVDAKGKYADFKYDGRLMVGLNKGKVLVNKQAQ